MSSAIGYKQEGFRALRQEVDAWRHASAPRYLWRLMADPRGGTVFADAAGGDVEGMRACRLADILVHPAGRSPEQRGTQDLDVPLEFLATHHNRDYIFTERNNQALLNFLNHSLAGITSDSVNDHRVRSSTIPGLVLSTNGYPDPRGILRHSITYTKRESDIDLPPYYRLIDRSFYEGPDLDLVYEHPDYTALFEQERNRYQEMYGQPYIDQDGVVAWRTSESMFRPPRHMGDRNFHRNTLEVRIQLRKTRSGIPIFNNSLGYPVEDLSRTDKPRASLDYDPIFSVAMTPYLILSDELKTQDVRTGDRINNWDNAGDCKVVQNSEGKSILIPKSTQEVFTRQIEPGNSMEDLPPLALLEEILRIGRKGIEYAPLTEDDLFHPTVYDRSQALLTNNTWRHALYDAWSKLPEDRSYYGAKFAGEILSMVYFDYQKARDYLIKTNVIKLFPYLTPLLDEKTWSIITESAASPSVLYTSAVLRAHPPIAEITQIMGGGDGNRLARSKAFSPGSWWGDKVVEEFVRQNTSTFKVLAEAFRKAGLQAPHASHALGKYNYLNYLAQFCAFDSSLI